MLRTARTVAAGESDGGRERWLRPLVGGLVTALASAAVVVVLTVLGALSAAHETAGAAGAAGVGSALWLLAGGARLSVGTAAVALTPLLGFALVVLGAWVGALRSLPPPAEEDPAAVGGWAAGYVGGGGLAVAATLLGPVRPVWASLLLPLVLVPALALAGVLGRRGLPGGRRWRLPRAVVRGVRPGLEGAALLLAAGGVLVVAAVLTRLGEVTRVAGELAAGGVGLTLLGLVELLALPNLALWAVAFVAGPGFSVTEGAHAGLSGAQSGLLPMVPVLAAVPGPGSFPWAVHLLVLVPVLVGGLIARRCLRAMPRLAGAWAKIAATAVATALAAVVLGVLDGLGGGALGAQRLSDVGAPAVATTIVLLVELGAGAAVVLVRDWWALRR